MFWQNFMAEIPDGMVICLENVLEKETNMLIEIIQAVNSQKLRMCLDVGHVHAYSEHSALEWLHDCSDLIAHFHIHNNNGTQDSHSALNCGTIPIIQLLQAIDVLCPTSSITLELTDSLSSIQWLMEQDLLQRKNGSDG